MKREEAVAILKELSSAHLIQPSLVLIQQKEPDKYQLKVKGDFSCQDIEIFLKGRGFSCEENNNHLVISEP